MIININNVLTVAFSYFSNLHPGGASIMERFCGTDATTPFSQIRNHNLALLDSVVPDNLIGSAC